VKSTDGYSQALAGIKTAPGKSRVNDRKQDSL
jgi:hypothetical protein